MTMDQNVLDELERMSNPERVQEAVQTAGRPFNKPKWTEVIADIGDIVGPYDVAATGNQQFGYRAIKLPLTNMSILAAEEALQIVRDDYEIRIPAKESVNGELYLMTLSASKVDPSINSIVKFPGLKQVHLKETIHTYKSRRPTDEDRKDEKTGLTMRDKDGRPMKVWKDVDATTYYYEVVGIGDKGVSKAASSSEVTPELNAEAFALIPDEGIEEATFKGKALRTNSISSSPLGISISNGSWITQQIENGSLKKDGDMLMKV